MSWKGLTETDLRTLRSALNHAMDDRAGYAATWPKTSREAQEARLKVHRYERLYAKIFGAASERQQQMEADNAAPSISIFDLIKGHPHD